MTNNSPSASIFRPKPISLNKKHLRKRKIKDLFFSFLTRSSIFIASAVLFSILCSIIYWAIPAFFTTELEITLPLESLYKRGFSKKIKGEVLIKESLLLSYPSLEDTPDLKEIIRLFPFVSQIEFQKSFKEYVKNRQNKKEVSLLKHTFYIPLSTEAVAYLKSLENREIDPNTLLTHAQQHFLKEAYHQGKTFSSFNTTFFMSVDSQNPELAGIKGAVFGSLYVIFITLCLAVPIGVLSSIYLEEFASDTRFTRFIEINLNNLAAVPSVVFGLLGLAIFIGFFKIPRSSALVGGLTLTLMLLPIMIVTTRASLRAIPSSLRNAALSLGASPVQVVFHHIVPLAFPGIITGTLFSIARLLGESASLLMVGMMAFILSPPSTILSPTTVLPVQIYQWVERAEPGFEELSSAAILCLLLFLACLNCLALFLRRKFEKRW